MLSHATGVGEPLDRDRLDVAVRQGGHEHRQVVPFEQLDELPVEFGESHPLLGRARVEAGLVYMKGRLYYHAWNLMYLGQWITVDPVFGQLPADVSHLRFVTGSPERQMDIMAVIGKISLTVLE